MKNTRSIIRKRLLSLTLGVALVLQGTDLCVLAQTVDSTYKEGTYIGEAVGYDEGNVKVTVTLQEQDGATVIQDISTEQTKQTEIYWKKAVSVVDSIKENNGTDNVDTVSGATISSKAIIDATDAALSKAMGENVFDGGVGSKANPYLIASRDTFEAFGTQVAEGNDYAGKYIALKNDIDLQGEDWTPIGDSTHLFAGTFLGNDCKILNLTIGSKETPADVSYAGLFGAVANTAQFYDITMEQVSIYTAPTKAAYAGGLVAYAKVNTKSTEGCVIQNCHVTGSISVDTNGNAIIMAGGLLGFGNQYMTMANCGADVSLSAVSASKNANAGGLVGFASARALFMNCYALGRVTVDSTNSGSNNAAGLIAGGNGMIYNCYSDVAITADQPQTKAGGLLGNGATATIISNSYYNMEKTAEAIGKNESAYANVTGKTSEELKSEVFKNLLSENLSSGKQAEFAEKITENVNALSGCDFAARTAVIKGNFYDWKIEEEKIVHSDELWANSVIDENIFASGNGSKETPYIIETEKQLKDFAASLTEKIDYENLYVALGNDIQLTEEWIPVGEGEYAFNGNFDGRNYSITGIRIGTEENPYVDSTGDDARVYFGFFGVLEEKAEVRNLKLDVSVYAFSPQTIYVSGLAGYINQAMVDNVQVTGEIQGVTSHSSANIFVGGLGGYMYKQKLTNCSWDGSVRAEAVGGVAEAGGIAGLNNRGLIANCYAKGQITGTADRVAEGAPSLGGIAAVHAGTMVNCYSVAEIIADCYTGYCGALTGWATGIGDTFQSYYCTDTRMVTDDKTENRLEISPAVACGWSVGPGINDEGEPYTGSVSLFVEGLSKTDMESDLLAEKLNENFTKLSVDLNNGGRQSGHWSGSEVLAASMKQWKTENNQVVLSETPAEVTYDTATSEYIQELLPIETKQYNEGIFYGRNAEKNLVVKIVVDAEKKVADIQVTEGDAASYVADIAKALEMQSAEGLTDSGFKEALQTALDKSEAMDITTYGKAGNYIFAGGDGSKENPWQIATEEQLTAFASYVNEDENYQDKYIVLTKDITLTKEWIPAGSVTPYAFAGNFDGNGKKLVNLTIGSKEKPYAGKYAGLFAYVKGGIVKNLTIENTDITIENTGSDRIYAGGVAAAMEQNGATGYLDNLIVDGKISIHSNSGACYAGGIVGQANGGTVTNCGASMEISAVSDASWVYAGGILGINARNGLLNNYADGNIYADGPLNKAAIGGIAGFHAGASYNNYANVQLTSATSTGDIGAIAGRNTGIGYMADCYYNENASQKNGGVDVTEIKAVGTVVKGDKDGFGTVENLFGRTETASEEFAGILNRNKTENDRLDKVLTLLRDNWENPMNETVHLFGWKTVAGGNVICQAGVGEEVISPETPEPTQTVTAVPTPSAKPTAVPVKPTATPSVTNKPTPTPKPVKKNDIIVVNGASYKVTSTSKKTAAVSYQAPKSKNSKAVTIPSTVKYKGVTYKVTAISDKACAGMSKLTKVTIGANVKTIGKNAFKSCKNLKTITIKSTKLNSVGKNAIKGIYKKAVIKCPAKKVNTYKKLFKKNTGYVTTMKIKK